MGPFNVIRRLNRVRGAGTETVGPILAIIGIVALIGVVIYVAHLIEQRRCEALAALAQSLGWRFTPERDREHDGRFRQFDVFQTGHSRAAYNTITGTIDSGERRYAVQMGDYTYKVTRHTGKHTSTSTYHLSYLIVRVPFQAVPDLLIRREGIMDKLAGALGFDDIDFESAEFSRRFFVKSPDKKFAYDVVHPRMMEFLMAGEPPAAFDLREGHVCVTNGTRRWEGPEFRTGIEWMEAFFALWPEHLTQRLEA